MTKDSQKGKKTRITLFIMLLCATGMVNANPIDKQAAQEIATRFLSINRAQSDGLADISEFVGFDNLYIFSTDNSFVVMPADDRAMPILGYSLTGKFAIGDMPDNLRMWLQSYDEQIQQLINNNSEPSGEIARQWRDLANRASQLEGQRTVVNPMITTTWDQGYPYNYCCPSASGGNGGHVYTGCVATAMAQIIKFHNAPVHGIGSHSYTHSTYGPQTADFNSTTYSWSNMPNSINSNSPQSQINAVATLMYHCGVSVDMNYGVSSSGAFPSAIASALRNHFNFSQSTTYVERNDYSDTQWITMIQNELLAYRPVVYGGHNSANTSGHSFLCDGFDTGTYGDLYFHFNWGWSGTYDGHFSINDMTPGEGGAGGGDHNYSYFQDAVIYIQPSPNTANPTNLTFTQNDRNITLHWTTASGASNYKIYCNNNIIGTTSSNSFTTIAPFGSSTYYVRSVNSSGELSLSSNAVSVSISYPTPIINDLSATTSESNVTLNWTAPSWCYPSSPTATLSYGDGSLNYSWTYSYYAHKYPASSMSQYANKTVYKVGTYIQYPGTYTVYIYTNTSNGQPSNLAATKTIEYSDCASWYDIILDQPIVLSGTTDLWVVMRQQNTGQTFPAPSFTTSSYIPNACYAGNSPTSLSSVSSDYSIAWFIKTYITDGVYTYRLFRNDISIADNLSSTTYQDNNLANGSYTYYVKTNYYAGQSAASNSVSVLINNGVYYTITASCNPTNGGSVSGSGTYGEGQSCTVTATPATGYTFLNWTENGTQVSSNANYTFTVTGNRNLVAQFQAQTYNVTATANPSNGGTVTGGGSFNYGQSCTVTATPATGYTFLNWTENGTQVSSNANYTFTVTENRNLVANFTSQNYIITASASPEDGGTITGAGGYNYGDICTLVAIPDPCYTFTNWTENGTLVSTDATYTFTVTDSRNLVANFDLQTHTITVELDPSEGGYIIGEGTYDCGENVTLEAAANEHYSFIGWFDNDNLISASPTMNVTVNSDLHFTARFALSESVGENENAVEVYPNPTKDKLTIEILEPVRLYEIYSITGALIDSQINSSEILEIHVGELPAGSYFIRLTTDHSVLTKKFIKR